MSLVSLKLFLNHRHSRRFCTTIIATASILIAVAACVVVKINHDNQIEEQRIIAVNAQIEADKIAEEARIAQEKQAAEEAAKAEAEKIAKAKIEAEAAEKAAALAEKAAAEKAAEKAEAEASKPNGGKPTSPPKQEGIVNQNPDKDKIQEERNDEVAAEKGEWEKIHGSMDDFNKKTHYDNLKEWIGKPEPTDAPYSELFNKLKSEGFFVKTRWISGIGMWEAKDEDGIWMMYLPMGGSCLHADVGLETPTD